MLIMFLISATGATSAVTAVHLAIMWLVDGEHRLRPDRLHKREGGKGAVQQLAHYVVKVSLVEPCVLSGNVLARWPCSSWLTMSSR